jgi:hypothetical protein
VELRQNADFYGDSTAIEIHNWAHKKMYRIGADCRRLARMFAWSFRFFHCSEPLGWTQAPQPHGYWIVTNIRAKARVGTDLGGEGTKFMIGS